MDLPKIDVADLPELPDASGLFSAAQGTTANSGNDDTLIVLMTYVYELML